MKRKIINGICRAGTLLSTETLIRRSKKKNIFLLYHLVADDTPLHIKHLYRPRTRKEFSDDIDFLSRHFNFISTAELANEKSSKGKCNIHLSFDDGLRECYDTIRPILLQKGIPAVFFVNPAFIDNHCMFHCHKASLLKEAYSIRKTDLCNETGAIIPGKEFLKTITSAIPHPEGYYENIAGQLGVDFYTYLQEHRPYLRLQQLKKMKDEGFEFGGHTLTHPHLSILPAAEQFAEISGSLQWLNENGIADKKYFAFPFHDIGIRQAIFLKMKETGVAASFGTSGMKEDMIETHHHRSSFEDSDKKAPVILKQQLFKYILQRLVGQNKIIRH